MPPRRRIAETKPEDVAQLFAKGLKRAITNPNIHGYKPHDKQKEFHQAIDKSKLYLGGNRGGKTVGGCVEDIWWATGQHPYRDTPRPPIRGRVVAVDFEQGVDRIILPEITRWLPPSQLINGSWEDSYKKGSHTLTLSNGSFIEFMSYDQDIDKFAGTSRHFIHYDEEPPKSIFTECNARLVDTGGSYWLTMTPLLGMASFIYDDIYLPGKIAGSGIKVVQVEMMDNPYISAIEAERFLSGLSADERKAREKGEFVQIGGLAFKIFRPDVHVIPADQFSYAPLQWMQYASMDHGYNNPTSWHYTTTSPAGIAVTWDELYQNETTVPQWAQMLHERNREPGRRAPDVYVGDPAIKQRAGQTGMSIQAAYAQEGIPIVLGNNDQRLGVDKINDYLRIPQWFITDRCPNLIRQMTRTRWKTWANAKQRDSNDVIEQLHDYDKHATDDIRYLFATVLPKVKADHSKPVRKDIANQIIARLLSPITAQQSTDTYDRMLINSLKSTQQSEWTVIDEHMGGIY